jgi:hypothetical protein
VFDQVQFTASVLLDGVPDAGRELRIGAEHLLDLVVEGVPYWIRRHGPILPCAFASRSTFKSSREA